MYELLTVTMGGGSSHVCTVCLFVFVNESLRPFILPDSLMPSAKLRSTNLPVFTSLIWCDAVRDRTPTSRSRSG